MGIVCLASLKGGVGKTSIAINIGHAFAKRGCRTLLIDLDPTAHTSHYFNIGELSPGDPDTSLAKLFLGLRNQDPTQYCQESLERSLNGEAKFIQPVRANLDIIHSSSELRYFYWGRGARIFCSLFSRLISELKNEYDHIIIDTPPDFNVLVRNAVAVSDLVLVPVDSSSMSIHCMEDIIGCCSHINGPSWGIIRNLVGKNAKKIQRLSQSRLEKHLSLSKETSSLPSEYSEEEELDSSFFQLMESEQEVFTKDSKVSFLRDSSSIQNSKPIDDTIYLLNAVINRTEQQNKLSYLNKTAFDLRETSALAEQYVILAREIEELLYIVSDEMNLLEDDTEDTDDLDDNDLWLEASGV
ncbi:MAG: ParA family protein [Deltaproteobacteria bacterium]|nr:ParA family protein [Deltaproteobacteria bacterium]